MSITTTTVPDATVGVAYSAPLAATGGITPYTWAVTTGTLPAGLTLDPSTGVISGTPTTAGASSFTVMVTDSTTGTPQTDTQGLSITVVAAGTPVSITTKHLPRGHVGHAYSATLAATGGATPYTWAVTSGTLPAGLTLDPSTGVISGTPTASGREKFTVTVTDSTTPTAQTDSKRLSIRVHKKSHDCRGRDEGRTRNNPNRCRHDNDHHDGEHHGHDDGEHHGGGEHGDWWSRGSR